MDSRSLVIESDPSCCLTQFPSVRGFVSVAARGCATAHSRAWGPTPREISWIFFCYIGKMFLLEEIELLMSYVKRL